MPRLRSIALLLLVTLTACRRDMADQPKLKPLGSSSFFTSGAASRTAPAHTVARDDRPVSTPAPVTRAQLERGRERYDIYCSVCHGRLGDGYGMIVQRGFPAPPTFHQARLREAPAQHYFDVVTNGFGVMYPYASRVSADDRWAIIAWIRVLQRSQNATLADADPAARAELEAQTP